MILSRFKLKLHQPMPDYYSPDFSTLNRKESHLNAKLRKCVACGLLRLEAEFRTDDVCCHCNGSPEDLKLEQEALERLEEAYNEHKRPKRKVRRRKRRRN